MLFVLYGKCSKNKLSISGYLFFSMQISCLTCERMSNQFVMKILRFRTCIKFIRLILWEINTGKDLSKLLRNGMLNVIMWVFMIEY